MQIATTVAACRPPNDFAGCFSTLFPAHHILYSRLCGMMIDIQKETPDGWSLPIVH